jgi:replicative DNA helicase
MNRTRQAKPAVTDLERRVPPHSPEAEMAVLGGALLRNEAVDQVRDLLDPEDFYLPAHQRLFVALCTLYDRGEALDPITLRNELKTRGWLEETGGAAYISRLLDEVHTTANIEQYARIVAEKALLRRLLDATHEIQGMVFDARSDEGEMLDTEDVLDRSQAKVFEVARESVQSPYQSLEQVIMESMEFVQTRMDSHGTLAGYSTGFSDLDDKTNGLRSGELVIVAARPAMGKTSLALNIATHIALFEKKPVLVFSLEMSAAQIGLRLLCGQSRVTLTSVLKGTTGEVDYQRLAEASQMLAEIPLYLDDSGGTNMNSIRAKARRLRAEKGELGMVVIDYIQLLAATRFFDSREREISAMSRSLKMLAKDLNCPVMALSQLNRQLETRPADQRRPRPSDLRESGSLEQDADLILFIYRDVVYNENTEEPDVAEVIIGKHRSGPTGMVKLTFLGEYTRFEQYTPRGGGGGF